MNHRISVHDFTLYWRFSGEILSLQPWGPDGARVRATNLRDFPEIPGALLDPPPAPGATATLAEGKGILTNGKLRAEIWPDGTLHFFNSHTGAALLEFVLQFLPLSRAAGRLEAHLLHSALQTVQGIAG